MAPLSRLTVLAQTSSLLAVSSSAAAAHCAHVPHGAFSLGPMAGFWHIVKYEGLRALWKGNVVTCVHRFPHTGVNFAVHERASLLFSEQSRASSVIGLFFPGLLAGCVSVAVCYPLEVVRTRLMAQAAHDVHLGHNWYGCLRAALRKEGITGIYRGITMSMLVSAPSVSVSFGVYRLAKDRVVRVWGLPERSLGATLFAGGLSGVVGSVLTFPLDVLRRRLQVMGMDDAIPKRSALMEAQHILASEGGRGLWRGLLPEMMKIIPTVAITFLTFEQLKVLV